MGKEYVEKRSAGYYIAGTRVSLDSIVYEYLNGSSPEATHESFPAVTLEQIYGSLAYYLANRAAIDEYLREASEEYEKMRLAAREKNPLLYRKLEEARRNAQSPKQK